MEHSKPSWTASRPAMRRALHQQVDAEPLILRDPYAIPILGKQAGRELGRKPSILDDLYAKPIRAWMVMRSRVAEDTLAAAVREHGAVQYLVLGAGLDTFALRNPYPGVRVFEVDHPATQAWKRERLQAANSELPPSATLVPVDFDGESLRERLLDAGFDFAQITVTAWLGVTAYLSPQAFAGTLELFRSCCPGSSVVFDYGDPSAPASLLDRITRRIVAAKVARMGEPLKLFFTPPSLRETLDRHGLRVIEDLGIEELNHRYFMNRADGLRLRGATLRLCHTRVPGAPGDAQNKAASA